MKCKFFKWKRHSPNATYILFKYDYIKNGEYVNLYCCKYNSKTNSNEWIKQMICACKINNGGKDIYINKLDAFNMMLNMGNKNEM